ncbi:MAG TPA: ribosome-associated translation inhibitor RaiA [Candidatus Dormibacteraeota bacterium]|nr:ribosome-associated translation inhibitor RaiA [Candidatus Dormibacteraeota bacterium]
MNLVIHAHDMPLPATIRSYAEAKVRRLDHHFDRILDARLEFDLPARKSLNAPKQAELHVHVQGRVLKGRATAPHLQEVVDAVVDKLDQQLRKRKERIKSHRDPHTGGKPGRQ